MSASDETVSFVQHRLPGLAGGKYTVTVSQTVKDSAGKRDICTEKLERTYSIAVMAERFSLKNPAATVASVFPPPDSVGDFSNVLPHVVFSAPGFPWARALAGDGGADRPTWLAVLLLDESETVPLQWVKAGDLCAGLEPGEQAAADVQVLDLRLDLFQRVAPAFEDLKLTAHERQVEVANKATGQTAQAGAFAIVFGTRLPQRGRKSHAYLVSLDGQERLLPGSDGAKGSPSGTSKPVRLPVLKTWSFTSSEHPARFVDALLALNGHHPAEEGGLPWTAGLRLPYTGTDAAVKRALAMGYVPLEHVLRTGERTISWYRGPLTPLHVPDRALKLPIASPDQAMIFDPTTGLLDASYAAAWMLGRLLALQDRSFSTALYTWKAGLFRRLAAEVDGAILRRAFLELPPAPPRQTGKRRATRRGRAAAPPPELPAGWQILLPLLREKLERSLPKEKKE